MKAYTDLNQSKKLAEILPLESADMCYLCQGMDDSGKIYYSLDCAEDYDEDIDENDIPCWSLAALLNVLEFPKLEKDNIGDGKIGWMVSVYPNNCRYDSIWYDNPIDACYEMIIKLNELKML